MISTQEFYAPGPRDLLWEEKSTSHLALAINGVGYQGELENSGRVILLILVEDRHSPSVPSDLTKRWQCERFTSSKNGARRAGVEWRSLKRRKAGGKCYTSHPSA